MLRPAPVLVPVPARLLPVPVPVLAPVPARLLVLEAVPRLEVGRGRDRERGGSDRSFASHTLENAPMPRGDMSFSVVVVAGGGEVLCWWVWVCSMIDPGASITLSSVSVSRSIS